MRLIVGLTNMPSARHANFNRAIVLSLLMMMMTQVGYLESINPWTNGEETLDEANVVLESSGSSFAYSNDKLSAGDYHTCGILDNGDLKCWGYDSQWTVGRRWKQHEHRRTFIHSH